MATDIPTRPHGHQHHHVPGGSHSGGGGSHSGGGTGSGSGGSSSSGSGSGGGGNDPYAQARADAQEAKKKASDRYIKEAERLQAQIKALRSALGSDGFRARLTAQLNSVRDRADLRNADLMQGYQERVGTYKESAADNAKSLSAQVFANLSNAGRERANALSEATANGAGETDVLLAQGAALRNWNANQTDVSRAFFDTQSSINAALSDATIDTRAALKSSWLDTDSAKEQLWNSYYDTRSETLTQLANTLEQQAEYYGYANEQVGSKKVRKRMNQADRRAARIFDRASDVRGQSYESPGISPDLRRWDGHNEFRSEVQSQTIQPGAGVGKPSGATLRVWEA